MKVTKTNKLDNDNPWSVRITPNGIASMVMTLWREWKRHEVNIDPRRATEVVNLVLLGGGPSRNYVNKDAPELTVRQLHQYMHGEIDLDELKSSYLPTQSQRRYLSS